MRLVLVRVPSGNISNGRPSRRVEMVKAMVRADGRARSTGMPPNSSSDQRIGAIFHRLLRAK